MKRFDTIFTSARRWLTACACVAAATVMAVAPAHGQLGGQGGFADMATRDYLHRDMPIVAQVLELDDNQRMILDNLFEDYVDAFETGWQETQERITNMLDDGKAVNRDNVLDVVLRPFEEWNSTKIQLKQQFESSVRSILNERQVELWPQFERRMVREKTLHQGRLSGESVNLLSIVRDTRLDERSRLNIEPILEQYEIDLHEALTRRNEALNRVQHDMFATIRSGQNLSAQADAHRSLINLHVAVRNINDRYREQLATSLPHETGRELRSTSLERGYGRIYRELSAVRAYRQALELEDLDEETREAVRDLQMIFEAELEVLNSRLLAAFREFEPRQLANEVDVYVARQQGEPINRIEDPTRVDLRNRDERASYYLSLLRELIGEELFAQIPAGRRIMDQAAQREAAAAARQRIRDRRESATGGRDQSRSTRGAEQRQEVSPRRGGDSGRSGGR